MTNIQLTQELVKSVFNYKDGLLYWKISIGTKIQIGKIAGGIENHPKGDRWRLRFNGKAYLNSRIIFLWHHGYLPVIVDHKDRNTANNKIENLRAATPHQNSCNRKSAKNSSSKYLGVCLFNKYFIAKIKTENGNIDLGYFKTEIEAAKAYNEAAKKYHGEFANINELP